MTRVFCPALGGRGRYMEEVKEAKFEKESVVQAIIGDNLDVIFPDLEIVGHEISLKDNRVDTVAFNVKTRSFVLIEYKKVQNDGALVQVLAYLEALRGNEGNFLEACKDRSGRKYDKKDVVWNRTKAILIAPSFTPRERAAAKQIKGTVELYRISKYENRVITMETEIGPKLGKSPDPELPKLDILYTILEKVLHGDLHLEKVKTRVYDRWILKNGKGVCTVAKQAKTLVLCYTTKSLDVDKPDDDFVRHMVKNGKKIGKKGLGDYMSTIQSKKDVDRTIRYLKLVCKQKDEDDLGQKQAARGSLLGYDDKKYVTQRGAKKIVRLYDEFKNALCGSIPSLEFALKERYINWKLAPNGKSICTVTVYKNTLTLTYNTRQLDVSKSDADFVRHLFNNGKRISIAGLGYYDSKIKTKKDIEKAIPYINKVYLQKVG